MVFDLIVKETRDAGAKLAADAGNDVHRFFENLRQAQKGYNKPLVQEPVPRYETAGKTGKSARPS